MPKIEGNEIRVGNVIEHKGRVWRVLKTEHVKPGKGGAYIQLELRDLFDGNKTNDRVRSAETLERVRLEQRPYQFLFADGDEYTFMDQDTFEQLTVNQGRDRLSGRFPDRRHGRSRSSSMARPRWKCACPRASRSGSPTPNRW